MAFFFFFIHNDMLIARYLYISSIFFFPIRINPTLGIATSRGIQHFITGFIPGRNIQNAYAVVVTKTVYS